MPDITTEKPETLPMTQEQRELAELRKRREIEKRQASESNQLAIIPNHISACIDASGSMDTYFAGGSHIANHDHISRKDAAVQALRRLVSASDPKTTAYSLIQFGSYAKTLVPKTTNYTAIQTARIDDGGGTNMDGGLFQSIAQNPTRIVLLSDGDVYYRPESSVAEAKKKGIIIDTISIGEANDEVMKWIAAETGGTWKRCDDLDALSDHFLMLEPS